MLPNDQLDEAAPLGAGAAQRLERLLAEGRLSARGLQRVRRVALTIADLAGHGVPLATEHLDTALHLRCDPLPGSSRLAG